MHAEKDLNTTASYIVRSISALPPLPSAAREIVEQFDDEFIDADKVAQTVQRDPGICAKLLGLANSAYFNLPQPVTDMREAISRVLGVDTVRSLVFAMALNQSFRSGKCPAFDTQRFWLDSLCVAEGCKKLARSKEDTSESVRNLAYPAGLCHNLGLMALAHIEAERTCGVLQAHNADPRSGQLSTRLRTEFGTDHRYTTLELARHWSLPEPMIDVYAGRSEGLPPAAGDRLGEILDACAAAVSNANGPEESRVDLDDTASRLGLTAGQLEKLAEPGPRQKERLRSVAAGMNA